MNIQQLRGLSWLPIVLIFASLGCGTQEPPASQTNQVAQDVVVQDPWANALATLRKQTDLGTCRVVLNQLNAELQNSERATGKNEHSSDAIHKLQLSKYETNQLLSEKFTDLDAVHLNECLLLNAVISSLDISGLPNNLKAQVIFDWVTRNLYTRNWIQRVDEKVIVIGPPVSPSFLIRRGYGTGYERAILYIELLKQAGLKESFLLGPPNLNSKPLEILTPTGQPSPGPFFAVAIEINNDLLLYDPWRGRSFAKTIDGKPVTLAELLKSPESLKVHQSIDLNQSLPPTPTIEMLQSAKKYQIASISQFSRRMKNLEDKLQTVYDVSLVTQGNIGTELGISQLDAYWIPPTPTADRWSPFRNLSNLLPLSEGGTDRTPNGPNQIYTDLTFYEPVPISSFQVPAELVEDEARSTVLANVANWYKLNVIDIGAREKLARGSFNELTRQLIEKETLLLQTRERFQNDKRSETLIKKWIDQANNAYKKLSRARLQQNRDRDLSSAQLEVEQLWKDADGSAQVIISKVVIPVAIAEIGYQMANAKHEQAIRAQNRFDRLNPNDAKKIIGRTQDSWAVAADAWQRYLANCEVHRQNNPSRVDTGEKLAILAKAALQEISKK